MKGLCTGLRNNGMECSNTTLLGQITDYLSSLSSSQLTALLCADCFERHDLMPETRPVADSQGKEGICSFCFADRRVSSPYLNYFLSQRINIDNEEDVCMNDIMNLVQDWLLPVGYLKQRREDLRFGECESWTWILYGAIMRRTVEEADLRDESKRLLGTFFREVYAANRFSTCTEQVSGELYNQPMYRLPRPAQSDAKPTPAVSRFFKTIIRQIKNWKGGKRNETS